MTFHNGVNYKKKDFYDFPQRGKLQKADVFFQKLLFRVID
jgi:hypothetical protein